MNEKSIINHIAFIMDGNGRWAKAKGFPRELGHREGAKNFKKIVRHCGDIGINCVTVYAFSTENWKRPEQEINALMKIFRKFIAEGTKTHEEDRVRVVFIGNKNAFPEDMQKEMNGFEALTSCYDRTLCVALNYGGRAEITDAVNAMIAEGMTSVTESDITAHIYSGTFPPPDMIVRTGGEMRLSNFLMWQSSYSELFFSDTLWPDFSEEELDTLINEFGKRKRRFGGV